MEKKRNVRAPKSIEVIRLRPGQFIGDNTTCNHLIHECIDNFLDELRNNFGNKAGISFSKEGAILVFDNGRGLPVGTTVDEETRKEVDSIELLFTKLHSGTKFSLEDDSLDSLFGQNGVGLVAVNALSEFVDVKTRNNDDIWHYVFKDGNLVTKEKIENIRHSTEIIFKPNKKYFKSVKPDIPIFYERMKLAQAKIPNSTFLFNSKEIEKENLEMFARQKLELAEDTPIFTLKYETKIDCSEPGVKKKIKKPAIIEVFITYESGNTIISGDVNLRFCDGTFLSNIQSLIKSILPSKIDKKFQKAPERFLMEGLRLYVSLQHPTPQFDSQTKTRFVSDVKNDLIVPIENNLSKILGNEHIRLTVEEILSQKMNSSISKIAKKKISSDNKLRDCTNKPGDVLYILEGDSAESVFRNCRNTHTEANLPIRGKILNVEKQSLAKISANKEIKNIIEAMGEYPYRYKQVKIVSDADCLSGNTIVYYRGFDNNIYVDKIKDIKKNKIKSILSYNVINNMFEEQPVLQIIDKPANKKFIEFTLYGSEKIQSYYDHGFLVYDKDLKKIIFLNANQIDKNKHYFISPKKLNNYNNEKIIDINDELIGIKIKNINNIDDQDRAYCFIVEKNHNFIIGKNHILTFNCDGLHINVLVMLIFQKYFPDIISEGRLSIVVPPLYGAKKGKEFIPIYDIRETDQYKKKNYEIHRFKGLGEMTSDQMRYVLDKKIEYVVQMPKNKKVIDNMLKIITDVDEKRKYLDMMEYNFDDFITSVFEGLPHDNE